LCVSRVLADWLEKRIRREPRIAGKPVVHSRPEPPDGIAGAPELGERRAHAVRDVMIYVRIDAVEPLARLEGTSRRVMLISPRVARSL
jgi:hypothetical protein